MVHGFVQMVSRILLLKCIMQDKLYLYAICVNGYRILAIFCSLIAIDCVGGLGMRMGCDDENKPV
jgi:hypothetical protein